MERCKYVNGNSLKFFLKTMINDGWLNLYKPKFLTSTRALGIARKNLGLDRKIKIGHAGTLDPLAEGVLPIAIGQATKLIPFMMGRTKQYKFTIQFGTRTTTADSEGEIIETTSSYPSREAAFSICDEFLGYITQSPPKFSAIKIGGVRAYTLARQGQEIVIPSRQVEILALRCTEYSANEIPTATYEVTCSKGTYIRSLAEDMSDALGSLGFVISLVRQAVGDFTEEKAVHLDYLSSDLLHPMDSAILEIPRVEVDSHLALRIRQGQKIKLETALSGIIRIHCGRHLIAVGIIEHGVLRTQRVFNN